MFEPIQLVFIFTEEADASLEDLLQRHSEEIAEAIAVATAEADFIQRLTQVCTYHTGTTLDGGRCAMCELDERYAANAPAPRWWERPLPVKDYTRSFEFGTNRAE